MAAIASPLRSFAVCLGTVAALACTQTNPHPACPERPAPLPTSTAPQRPSSTPQPKPSLVITLRPVVRDLRLAVEIVATGDQESLARWSIPSMLDLSDATFQDADGGVPHRVDEGVFTMSRPHRGALRATYLLTSRPKPPRELPLVEVTPDWFQATGENLLLLPDAYETTAVPTLIRFAAEDLGATKIVGSASSFGAGASRSVVASGRELRRGAYIAGPMGSGGFQANEGIDEAAWIGFTAFDPRPIAADVAAFRTAVGQALRAPEERPLTLLIVTDGRRPDTFTVRRRARSVLVHVGAGQAWTGALRIAVAAEVIHGWLGSRVWIGPSEPAREAESYWFSEGVTRHLAREMLFRFGLITPTEVLDEMHGLMGVASSSPLRGESNEALARRAKEPGVLPLLVARGALVGARTDFLLRVKSDQKTSLESWLSALLQQASTTGGALPRSAWTDLLAKDLGDAEREAFEDVMAGKSAVGVPRGMLGPCFVEATRPYNPFDLGFNREASMGSSPATAKGVREGGPAHRAGLREGDAIRRATIREGRSDIPVELDIERDGKPSTLRFKPSGKRVSGLGWRRNVRVPADQCVP